MTRDQEREQELERGRQVAARAQRRALLERYEKAPGVKVMVSLPGHRYYEPRGQVNIYHVDGVEVAHEQVASDDFPSDNLMAMLAMSIETTVGLAQVPATPPSHKISEETRAYHRQLRERNKGRSDIK